ncbi:LCP family protein [Streptomyces sp. WMMC905]|uniref:LCP family protein n=1 Tax=Streptomyces sp. WMMC905 TaxID=3404123 RepID=UPI003B93DE6D
MTHSTEPGSGDGATGSVRRTRRRGVRRWARLLLPAVVLALLAGGSGLFWLYTDLNRNIDGVDLEAALGDDRPEKRPLSGKNLLILGSDSRAGANADLGTGNVSGARSDTALVLHVPEGGTRAVAVSIPRDTLVSRPECVTPEGTTHPAADRVMFNSVYALVGPSCVVKTVEQLSGVRMDHYLEIDFSGFKEVVDAIGGVSITLDVPIEDDASGLDLEAGTHRLDSTEALAFVRTRHGIGDGSDLGRIELQQRFLVAMLSEIKRQDLLGSPTTAYRIADTLTSALTTDSDLASLGDLAELASGMDGIDPATMETITLPVAYDVRDPNRVVPSEPDAGLLWAAIREGGEIPDSVG